MSASPSSTPAISSKRPLEDPSSPSGPTDQPDAKRPALDKIIKGDEDVSFGATTAAAEILTGGQINSNGDAKTSDTKSANGVKVESIDGQGDTVVSDAPTDGATHAIESTVSSTRGQNSSSNAHQHDETGWIHLRSVISSAEAATVIGKGGENVTLIRKMSGAKCTVSDYQKGAVERILTVSGLVDAVAKVSVWYLY
jgi:heterogeneous nuclear rnp K-like protein 2